MRFVLISDTHGKHYRLAIPPGDVLIHAGDFSSRGHLHECQDFLEWFAAQPHAHKVFIAGNHDFAAEREPERFRALIPPGLHYLENSGITLNSPGGQPIRIWGSPVQPRFFNWAFNRDRGPDIDRYWQRIPPDTDILITHGPPMGILDRTERGEHVGCADLLRRIAEIKPRLNVFGHIHEAWGQEVHGDTLYVNASAMNLRYELVHSPVIWDWPAHR